VRRAWRVYLTVKVRYGGYQLPTISLRQGCPSWGGIWRKPAANFRSEEHEYHQAQVVGQVCNTKRNPINWADTTV